MGLGGECRVHSGPCVDVLVRQPLPPGERWVGFWEGLRGEASSSSCVCGQLPGFTSVQCKVLSACCELLTSGMQRGGAPRVCNHSCFDESCAVRFCQPPLHVAAGERVTLTQSLSACKSGLYGCIIWMGVRGIILLGLRSGWPDARDAVLQCRGWKAA